MKLFMIALALAGLALAFSVDPGYLDSKDRGSESLPKLNVALSVDCGSKELTATVTSNETGEPVEGATLYLFYTDYEYQLMGSAKTEADGSGSLGVIGKKDYLTALFILKVEKQGYRSKEIEFSYKKCFDAPPTAPDNTTNPAPPANAIANTTPQANVTPPANTTRPNTTGNATPPKPPANETPPPDNGDKPGTNVPPAAPPSAPCLPALLMPLAILAAFMRD